MSELQLVDQECKPTNCIRISSNLCCFCRFSATQESRVLCVKAHVSALCAAVPEGPPVTSMFSNVCDGKKDNRGARKRKREGVQGGRNGNLSFSLWHVINKEHLSFIKLNWGMLDSRVWIALYPSVSLSVSMIVAQKLIPEVVRVGLWHQTLNVLFVINPWFSL